MRAKFNEKVKKTKTFLNNKIRSPLLKIPFFNKIFSKERHSGRTKLLVSPFFILLAGLLIFLGRGFDLIFHLIALIVHEYTHAKVAASKGYKLSNIKIMPYGAKLNGHFEHIKPKDEVLIALSGPFANVILALLFIAIWWLVPDIYPYTYNFVYINVFMALVNLIPIYPLDGGRATLALLSLKWKKERVYKKMRSIGFIVAICFAALGFTLFYLTGNITLAVISIFFFASTLFADKKIEYDRLYNMGFRTEKIKKGLIVKEAVVLEDTSLKTMVSMLNSNYYFKFSVLNKNLLKIAEIDEITLDRLIAEFSQEAKLVNCLALKK